MERFLVLFWSVEAHKTVLIGYQFRLKDGKKEEAARRSGIPA